MSEPDPYSSPPREAEGRAPARPPYRPVPEQAERPPWGGPVPPPREPGSRGTGIGALVAGILALVLSVSVVGGLVLGAAAVALGLAARRRAAAVGAGAGLALTGIVLGVLGWVGAGATWLYVRDGVGAYRACERASVSFADDRECRRQLERDLQGG